MKCGIVFHMSILSGFLIVSRILKYLHAFMYSLQNVVLSGGSTMFRDFGRRLQRDVKKMVEARLKLSEELSGGNLKVISITL